MEQIEQIASQACFDINHQAKENAEKMFKTFVQGLSIQQYDHFFLNYSQTAVFVFCETINKNINEFSQLLNILNKIASIFCSWYRPNGQFIRQDSQQLKYYVQKSLANLIGNILKLQFATSKHMDNIIGWFQMWNATQNYQLYLYKVFIECVSTVDEKMGFISYSNLLTHFQDLVIPKIIDIMIPYFLGIEERLDIQQITQMQHKMNIAQDSQVQGNQQPLIENRKLTHVIFQLLYEIVNFKYALTYKDFEGIQENDSVITFPDVILGKLVQESFLESLFNVICKLINSQQYQQLMFCLECLKKIAMSKTGFMNKERKMKYYSNHLKLLMKLLQYMLNQWIKNNSAQILIIQCNIKFLLSFSLQEFAQVFTLEEAQALYEQWGKLIYQCVLSIFNSLKNNQKKFTFQNNLLMESMHLMTYLIEDASNQLLNNYSALYKEMANNLTIAFLELMMENGHSNIMGESKFLDLEEYGKQVSFFFQCFKKMSTCNYSSTLAYISNLITMFSDLQKAEISNIILIVSQLTEVEYFETGIFKISCISQKKVTEEEENLYLKEYCNIGSQHLLAVLYWIDQLGNQNVGMEMHNAILIFLNKFLHQCITNIQIIEPEIDSNNKNINIIIDYMFYKAIKLNAQSSLSDEEFLLKLIEYLCRYLQCNQPILIEFTFTCLNRLLSKLKWTMKRENFKMTKIYRQMLELFYGLNLDNLSKQCMKFRTEKMKILCLLSFDDIIDEYRWSISNVIKGMATDYLTNQALSYARILYDLTGILQKIDNATIFRYFLLGFYKAINFEDLISNFFNYWKGDCEQLKVVLHFNYLLINNHDNRLQRSQCNKLLYQLIKVMMPYWTFIIEHCIKNGNEEGLIEQLHLIFNAIINQGIFNLWVIFANDNQNYIRYIQMFLFYLKEISDKVEQSPEILKVYIITISAIGQNLQPFLTNQNLKIGDQIDQLFNQVMLKCYNLIDNYIQRGIVDPAIDSFVLMVEIYWNFIYSNSRLKHKVLMISQFNKITANGEVKVRLIRAMLKFGLGIGKNLTGIFKGICRLLSVMMKFYGEKFVEIVQQEGVSEYKLQELRSIVNSSSTQKETVYITSRMKSWLLNNISTVPIDY